MVISIISDISAHIPDPEKQKAASSKEKKRGTDKYQPQPATLLANPANIKRKF